MILSEPLFTNQPRKSLYFQTEYSMIFRRDYIVHLMLLLESWVPPQTTTVGPNWAKVPKINNGFYRSNFDMWYVILGVFRVKESIFELKIEFQWLYSTLLYCIILKNLVLLHILCNIVMLYVFSLAF